MQIPHSAGAMQPSAYTGHLAAAAIVHSHHLPHIQQLPQECGHRLRNPVLLESRAERRASKEALRNAQPGVPPDVISRNIRGLTGSPKWTGAEESEHKVKPLIWQFIIGLVVGALLLVLVALRWLI